MANRDLQLGGQKVTLNYLIPFVSQYGFWNQPLSHITFQQRQDFFVALLFVSGAVRSLPSTLGWCAELKQQKSKLFRSHSFWQKVSNTARHARLIAEHVFFLKKSHKQNALIVETTQF